MANYNKQYDLYLQMDRLAKEQLDCLESGHDCDSAGLWNILERRRQLMDEILQLNGQVQQFQKDFISEYGMAQFTLSVLRDKVDSRTYEGLKETIQKLGDVLHGINDIDIRNQSIMEQKTIRQDRVKTSSREAGQAYRQAMRQKKES